MPPKAKTAEAPICPVCWPDGWPGTDWAAACAHGAWQRRDPATAES